MQRTGISRILSQNDVQGERLIAVFQAFMAMIIFTLHMVSASKNNWESLSGITLSFITGILCASLLRIALTKDENHPTTFLHGLTLIDGALLFCLIYSYNLAYALPFAAAFKAPSIVLFVVFTCVRVVKFDPVAVLVAGFTVLAGWGVMHGLAFLEGSNVTSSYKAYLTTNSIMLGASFEFAVGYVCAVGALAFAMFQARGFVARTALVEDLEEANFIAEQNAAKFEGLFASSVEGIVIVDTEGNVEKANSAMARIFGFSQSELIGSNVEMLMSAEHAMALRASIGEFIARGSSALVGERFETEGTRKNGENFPIELSITELANSGHIRFAAFIQDIEERKRTEHNAIQAKAQFESAVNAAMDAIIIIDEAGMVVGFNPAAEETFGFKFDDIVGKRLSDTIIPDRYKHAHDQGMVHYLNTGEAPVLNSRIEIEGLHASGQEIMIELAIREIQTSSGKLFFGYARDISERKEAEQQLIDAKNEAELASSAKARFLAMMSHEIRTPLNGVLGIVNLLDETELDSEQKRLLETARESGQSLLSIINDILDFSKFEAGKFNIEKSPFELSSLTESIVNLIKPQATEKGLLLNLNIEPAQKHIFVGDADRIRQILINLVWNAVKFTETGEIDIQIDCEHEEGVLFSVTDTGIGIPEDKIGALFTEFSTLDEHRKSEVAGTGLGLVICKALVEAMGGNIHVSSVAGEGSRFWFTIPLERGEISSQEKAFSDGMADHSQLEGIKVLVAEDNVTNQLIIRSYLTRIGCLVDIAGNGSEAVAMYMDGKYDLVLMDISMPIMDGFEATAEIRRLSQGRALAPIIAFTAYASKEDQELVLEKGMDDYITKPFTREQLLGTMISHLGNDRLQSGASVQEHSETDSAVFDLETVASVFEGHDLDTTRALLQQFSSDLSTCSTKLRKGIEAADWTGVEKTSHSLKGASGMFGASQLCKLAERVNILCRDGQIEDQIELASKLIKMTDDVLNHVNGSADQTLPEFVSKAIGER